MTEYGVEEVLTLIEENGLEREVFMHLFRDSYFVADQLTADDCGEVFEGILKGKEDLTKERLEALCVAYDADLNKIVNGKNEGEERKQRFTGRVFRFRKEFGKTVADTKYFIFRDKEDKGEWVQIDGNLFIDLKAMIDEDKVRTLYTKTDVVELEIRTDARRERMFTTIAKHCYSVEV